MRNTPSTKDARSKVDAMARNAAILLMDVENINRAAQRFENAEGTREELRALSEKVDKGILQWDADLRAVRANEEMYHAEYHRLWLDVVDHQVETFNKIVDVLSDIRDTLDKKE